ncbi:MAG: DUF6572 domain-containing protein [Erythrobacter sp.]|uniref:DUF6572 domain-containing protein n=1 Tax=Erythrobacter sp. TaxID=1042 RepID=UPI0032996DF4
MSLDNTDTIDAFGIDSSDGQAVLTIVDGWDWQDERAHLIALQSKLNAYFAFVESNQIAEIEPAWREKGARIEVLFKSRPSDSAISLLKTAEVVAKPLNLGVCHRVHSV